MSMTEQELEQARDDLDQLDIEELRCGVVLQLRRIEALTKERDEYKAQYSDALGQISHLDAERDALCLEITGWKADQKENLNNQCDMADKVMGQARLLQQARIERDALAAAATLALSVIASFYECDEECDCNGQKAIAALKKAGVQ